MRMLSAVRALLFLIIVSPSVVFAQSSPGTSSPNLPRLINIGGVFRPANGQPAGVVETVTLSIYADREGGTPLWQETQTIALDGQGRYSLLLGATVPGGIPAAVFGSGDAQWLGTVFERPGEVEGPRVRITSVPYALRAFDADTLGGRPASAYLLAPAAGGSTDGRATATSATTSAEAGSSNDIVLAGTPNFLAKYVNTADVGNSGVFEAADGAVGLGTTTPFDRLHVRYNNNTGDFTGLAVQNLNGGALAYSGMLFFDHTNALTQFQGYNNATHEYRINNIARVSPGGAFNGSINFMLGGTSKFIVASTGNVGIGTTAPSALLEVSNAIPGGPANMWMTSFTNAINPYYMARRARGSPGAPTAVQNGDGLAGFYGEGYGATAFGSGFAGGMTVQAAQNWTDTAHGTALTFATTPINAAASTTRMTLDATGNVGIGTTSTPAAGLLEVSNAANSIAPGTIVATTLANAANSVILGSRARGTAGAPAAVQNGDVLVGFLGRGYGATTFSGTRGGMFVNASENWTDLAQGTRLNFNTTTNGTIAPATRMTIDNLGNVGVGTMAPSAPVEVVRQGSPAEFRVTLFKAGGGDDPGFFARTARGTAAAPSAVQLGDELGGFGATGYGATGFGEGEGGLFIVAAENWTDTAHGSLTAFFTTPVGTNEAAAHMAIMPDGNVGIGTFDEIPTIADKLQVFGNIRVGTTGTDGCIKNFAGTGIVGTCASDRRYKKDITPFGHVLNQLTALQPVHYLWRTADFPEQHFGDGRAYGLIAQDVEQTLPELVVTNDDGFKAIDYSKLPLLTIQAVKDLKSENDALKQRVAELEKGDPEALKRRVAELERLVNDLLATSARR